MLESSDFFTGLLGLSMVHGFMTQSGGEVRVTTAEGKGTTMELYFPAAGEP